MPDVAELITQTYVLSFPAFPVSYTVVQNVAANLKAEISQGTAANLKCEPTQTDSANLVARTRELGGAVLNHGIVAVAPLGVATQLNLGTSMPCKAVLLRARPLVSLGFGANVSVVHVGSAAVLSGAAWNSVWIAPGESVAVAVSDVNLLWVSGNNAGDALSWTVVVQ